MRVLVMLSGKGATLAALLRAKCAGQLKAIDFCGVISDQPSALGLLLAQEAGIACAAVDRKAFATKLSFEQALHEKIQHFKPDLIVLAGFMRVLSASFLIPYAQRIINLHPSLLPKFPGLNTHQRAIDAGEHEHGASVHWVTAELDGGAVIAQSRTPILPQDSVDSLQNRVKALEQTLLIAVLEQLSGKP
jgi:phosphoribosylglycinamide formyltransferase 1